MLSKEKIDALHERMHKLGVTEEDLIEKFILGSGRGGQKINKTSSCVYIKHLPTGIEVKCQQGRSREMNRYYARKELCQRLEDKDQQVVSERQMAAEKIRRQKRRRSRRSKEKMLADKKHHASKKQQRGSFSED